MAKASDYPFASVLLVEQSSKPTAPPAGCQLIYMKTDHKMYRQESDGTEVELPDGTPGTNVGPSLLGITEYGNATDSFTTTSATIVDVDATNCAVTFTAPPSGNVLVRITVGGNTSSGQNAYLGIKEGAAAVGTGHFCFITTNNTVSRLATCVFYITGISAGSHTYKVGAYVNGGATLTIWKAATVPVTIEVWSA